VELGAAEMWPGRARGGPSSAAEPERVWLEARRGGVSAPRGAARPALESGVLTGGAHCQ